MDITKSMPYLCETKYNITLLFGHLILSKILQRLNLSKNNLLDTFAFGAKCHFLCTKSLEYRQVEFDMILTYKICYNLIDLKFDEFFIKCNNNSFYNLCRHSFNINPLHCANTNSYNHFFTPRVPKIWNKLPENILVLPI